MKNFVRRLCSVSATLAVLLPVFAINFATSASAAEPVRLGAAVSLTGNLAKLGQETKQGYELWMEQVNANGGLNVYYIKG